MSVWRVVTVPFELRRRVLVIHHQDNTPSHTLLLVQQFLTEKNIPVIIQPPYSLDLAPNDFWLFPTLKMGLKGTRFATMEDIN
jgi:hypothetical protein